MSTIDTHRQIIYIAFIIILLFFGTVSYLWISNPKLFESTKFTNFCTVMSILGIILSFIVLVSEYHKMKDQKKIHDVEVKTNETQLNWIELEKLFISNYPYLSRLYSQMYATNPNFRNLDLKYSAEDWQKIQFLETHVCSILFQVIENICAKSDENDKDVHYHEWLPTWKSWFRSPIVQQQWNAMKPFYTPKAQACVNEHLYKLSSI
jgi:hypothetical protein